MTPEEQREYRARQISRSKVFGLGLAALAVLFYVITIVRMD